MLAASTKAPWTRAHFQGERTAAAWLNTSVGASTPSTLWWTTTYPRASPNGSQSWYRAMTPIITKKWKWASTTPPDRWTITAEAVIRPSTAAAERARRPSAGKAAATAKAAIGDTSATAWARPLPRGRANTVTPP